MTSNTSGTAFAFMGPADAEEDEDEDEAGAEPVETGLVTVSELSKVERSDDDDDDASGEETEEKAEGPKSGWRGAFNDRVIGLDWGPGL